jgi:hypothetical protein
MPRSKPAPPSATEPASSDQVERLIEVMEDVAAQLQVLRVVLDEIRTDFQWAVQNDKFRSRPAVFHLKRMPADPLASDFGERLQRSTPDDQPPVPAPPPEAKSPPKDSLFAEEDGS